MDNKKRAAAPAGGAGPVRHRLLVADETRQSADARFREIVEDLEDGYYEVDLRGTFVFFNTALCRMHGYRPEEMAALNNRDYMSPDTAAAIYEIFNQVYRTGQPVRVLDYEIIMRDGGTRVVNSSVHLIRDADGQPVGFRGMVRDVTDQRRGQTYERARNDVLEAIARNAPLRQTLSGVLTALQAQMPDSGALLLESWEGRLTVPASAAVPADYVGRLDGLPVAADGGAYSRCAHFGEQMIIQSVATDPRCDTALREMTRAAGFRSLWLLPIVSTDADVLGVLAVYPAEVRAPSDRERKWLQSATATAEIAISHHRANERLAYLSQHDPLTGLLNRRSFIDEAARLLALARRERWKSALLFIDLDRFKQVNDMWGHQAGDRLLRTVSHRLRVHLRDSECLARLGGDEFALLAPNLAVADVHRLVERIVEQLTEPVELEARRMASVGASVGVAFASDGDESVDTLLGRADTAMYEAKTNGLVWSVFEPERQEAALRAAELESELRTALRARSSELVLHYQPIRSSADGRIAGAEALVRWQHPERGMVGPPDFIPLAERSGMIVELDRLVLARAVAQLRDWDGWVSVNVSPRSMGDPDWPAYVRGVLAETGFPAERLVLEVTERTVLDTQRALDNAVELAGSCVQIALDDFGTGYSSLSQLAQLPVRIIKIDQALVRSVQSQPRNAAIVKAILALAQHLELAVVGEGVETEADLHWLRANDCGLAQGYFLGRPAPWRGAAFAQ